MVQLEVYADVVFAVNFGMDMLIFYISSKIVNYNINRLRWFLGSFGASALYCLLMFTALNTYINFLSTCAILLISVAIVFLPRNIPSLLLYSAVVTMVSFMLGGAVLVIFCCINSKNITGIDFKSACLPVKALFLSALGTGSAAVALINLLRKKEGYGCCNMSIVLDNNRVKIKGLIDTGNLLVDPISKKPVIIADFGSIKNLLPSSIVRLYEKGGIQPYEIMGKINRDAFSKCLRLIPFKTIGKENGIMLGFVADKAIVEKTEILQPVIGISDVNFGKRGRYNAIFNPSLINCFGRNVL